MTLFRMFSEKRQHLWAAACTILACALGTGCTARRLVTVQQVDEMIRNNIHVGSSKAEVVAFVGSLKIDSLQITHSDRYYGPELLGGFDHEKTDPLGDRLKEFYDATVQDVAPTTTTFMIGIRMRFYFDEDGKLLAYTIKEDTGFR